jgi:hypothetical protein
MHPETNHPFQPVFRFVIGSIRGYALCFLCIVTPWLWPVLIAGFLGGLWARRRQAGLTAPPIVSLPLVVPPPLPPLIGDDGGRSLSNGEIQSFAA